mgnify:CR=1 FL=1
MTREEFKHLFKNRRLYLVGYQEEVGETTHILEKIGFKGQTHDNYVFRQMDTFRGEIWATASGKNWRFQRPLCVPVADIPRHAIPIRMCDLIDIIYGEQSDDEELSGADLTEIL